MATEPKYYQNENERPALAKDPETRRSAHIFRNGVASGRRQLQAELRELLGIDGNEKAVL